MKGIVNKTDAQMIRDADIVICSYLPDDPKLATERFQFHQLQIVFLRVTFKHATILTLASNWPEHLKRTHLRVADGNQSTIFYKGRRYKAVKHNAVMQAIKGMHTRTGEPTKSVLILGDDVVPTKMDGIKRNPFNQIMKWIKSPKDMPAPCIFFSCKGTLRDTYYKARLEKGQRFSNTAAVTDWAFMIRSDFQVIMEDEEMEGYESEGHMASDVPPHQYNSDAMLRFKAASLGYEVLKDQEIFFETFQSTSSDKNSVWYANREARRAGVKVTDAMVRHLWPYLFTGKNPVWQARGKSAQKLIMLGLLHESKYGLYPNGPALRERWDRLKSNRNSLSDLL